MEAVIHTLVYSTGQKSSINYNNIENYTIFKYAGVHVAEQKQIVEK